MAILDDTRADWNARPPLRALTPVPWAERVGFSWHWIGDGRGPSAAGSHQNCLDQVREWQRQHQDPNGRIKGKDIGYNALICQHARAIEGRGLAFSGAHSPGVNWGHVGVQFMTGSAGITPTVAMIARAVKLRYDVGQLGKNIRRDWGHRDDPKASTTCPGNWITNWVRTGGPTKYAAPTTPTSPEEDDMDLTEENARQVHTRFAIFKNPFGTTPADVAPAYVAEQTAKRVLAVDVKVDKVVKAVELLAAAPAPPTGLNPARAETILREEIGKWLSGFTITQKEQP